PCDWICRRERPYNVGGYDIIRDPLCLAVSTFLCDCVDVPRRLCSWWNQDVRMLPVMRPDGVSTARQIVICSLLLIPISLIPSYLHMTTVIYFVSAAVLVA